MSRFSRAASLHWCSGGGGAGWDGWEEQTLPNEMTCAECGAVIPDGQPNGLCPRCAQAGPRRPEFLPIATERLVLRRFTEKDAAAFHAYRNDPKVARYQSWESCGSAEAREFVRHHATQPFGVPGEWLQIAVAFRDTDQLIGDCAVRVRSRDPRQATFGVTFARRFQCRGYAIEALSALFEALFIRAGLHRIVADTDAENTAAWTLAEQLGMRREAHLRQSLWFKGRWTDEFHYAILREEWLATRTPAEGGAS